MTPEFIRNMDITEVLGMAGALIAVAAYFPQIIHLIRERCTAGLSRAAFSLWFLSSFLITIHAFSIRDTVFISLGVAQLVLIALILYYCTRYKGLLCPTHTPRAATPRR